MHLTDHLRHPLTHRIAAAILLAGLAPIAAAQNAPAAQGAARLDAEAQPVAVPKAEVAIPSHVAGIDGLRGALGSAYAFNVTTDLAVLFVASAVLLSIGSYLFSKIQL